MNIEDKFIAITNNPKTKFIIIGFIISLIIFLTIGFTIGKYNPDPNSKIVTELLNKLLYEDKLKYDQIIKEKDSQISNIQLQLNQSQNINSNYQKEISKLKNQLNNIKPPENENEIRERFKGLGYETY